MRLPRLTPGRFVRRDNRFRATIIVEGEMVWAHVANSGRLTELLTPQRAVWLARAAGSHRKTAYDLKLVEFDSTLVSVDARMPNPLVDEALADSVLPGFRYSRVDREVSYGDSRLDFRLSRPEGVCWVETKSVTLVVAGTALFPDAPTDRGRKHLQELTRARGSGDQAAVVFVIQRSDAERFMPHQVADPAFAIALAEAADAGVALRAFTCDVSKESIAIADEIPVMLP